MVKVKVDMSGWVMKDHGVPDSRLTVIEQAEDYISKSGKHYAQWLCSCSCNNKKLIARSDSIINGGTKSCGCLEKETTQMKEIKNNYQIMTYAEMAKFINDMEFNKVYSFSTYWVKDKKYPEHYSFGIWYGFIKQRLFDTTVITLGAFGGMDVHAFDYGYNATLGEIEQKFIDYVKSTDEYMDGDTSVVLDTIPC